MSDATPAADAAEEAAAGGPEQAYGVPVSWSRGQRVLHPTREQLREVVAALRGDGFDQLIDVTAVDYLTAEQPRRLPAGVEPERMELVVGLLSHAHANPAYQGRRGNLGGATKD